MITGRVHSFQSLGTVDGPGVRFVVFLQGCPLRCSCCHNPDTHDVNGGKQFSSSEIVKKALSFKEYFGKEGGITLSGGEPLLQADFSAEIFKLAKENGLNTCLDTSGCIINDGALRLLEYTDRVLLDIKYADDNLYRKYVGCSIKTPLEFLEILSKKNIPTTIRQVIIPTVNCDKDSVIKLKNLVKNFANVDKIELLPFKKICQVKYDNLGLVFPFGNLPVPTKEQMQKLNELL